MGTNIKNLRMLIDKKTMYGLSDIQVSQQACVVWLSKLRDHSTLTFQLNQDRNWR